MAVPEQILELFPLEDVSQRAVEELDDENQAGRLKQVQQNSTLRKSMPVPNEDDQNVTRPGEYYKRYRTIEELPKDARAFYEIAGKL